MDLATGGELFDLLTTQEGDHFSEPFAAALMTQMLASVREATIPSVVGAQHDAQHDAS